MKGIVLAGGVGSRLWPITLGVSKQLLPIYDKPLVYYPISTLMLAQIREILVITTPKDQEAFQRILGDGSRYGIRFEYAVQEYPSGIAQAFQVGEKFIGCDSVALILGDNIFYGHNLNVELPGNSTISGAHIFAYLVKDPQRYGVVEIDPNGSIKSLQEKPIIPKSAYAVTGLYFYDNEVVSFSKKLQPSRRGELEITDINNMYLKKGRLKVTVLPRGTVWLDTGTFESLSAASSYIQIIEERQGQKISCLEEIAWRNKWINDDQLVQAADSYQSSPFADYLRSLLN